MTLLIVNLAAGIMSISTSAQSRFVAGSVSDEGSRAIVGCPLSIYYGENKENCTLSDDCGLYRISVSSYAGRTVRTEIEGGVFINQEKPAAEVVNFVIIEEVPEGYSLDQFWEDLGNVINLATFFELLSNFIAHLI